MDSPVLTSVVLPAALAVIMFSLGLSLTREDFRRVLVAPRGVGIGMLNLALISPLLALAMAELFALPPELAVGLVLLGASPGGMMANMLTHLSRGDTALSVTMTAVSSVGAIITVPLFLELSANHFGAIGLGDVSMLGVVARVFAITIVPVSIGMELRRRRPVQVEAAYPRVRSIALGLFAVVVAGAIASEYDTVAENLTAVGGAALALNLTAMTLSFAISKLARLDDRQSTAIALELGIHNSALAIAVAAPLAAELTIPAAVYASFMLFTGGGFAWAMSRRNADAANRDGPIHSARERDRMNLASTVTESAARSPEAAAIRLGEAALSYAELDERSARLATLLRERGLERGDRVGVMLPNVPDFPIAYYGVLRAGGVVVPMNVLLKRREVAFHLEDSGAKLLLAWHGFAEEAEAGAAEAGAEPIEVEPAGFAATLAANEPTPGLADTAEEDTAVILYTSGTTGKPKGAELTHLNLSRNAEVASRTTCEIAAGDVVLGALPLFHSFGQTVGMNASLRVGACLTLVPKFDPGEALATMQRDGVTHFYGVPTMFGALLHHPGREGFDASALRTCITGGASMPVEVLRGFEGAFGAVVLEGYGLSETSPVASSNHPHMERKPGSIGTPIEGVEMRVVDEDDEPVPQGEVGEIVIRGHNVMKGYWRRPEATEEAMRGGWFHSGDMARVDEEGYFYIVDRKKDLIIRGGYNVYPREVEEVLYEHPKIREAAVVGVPDDEWGEEIGAAVVLHEGEELGPEEVGAYVKERIAAYKYPRVVWFVDDLPKGPTGKILKREIEIPAAA